MLLKEYVRSLAFICAGNPRRRRHGYETDCSPVKIYNTVFFFNDAEYTRRPVWDPRPCKRLAALMAEEVHILHTRNISINSNISCPSYCNLFFHKCSPGREKSHLANPGQQTPAPDSVTPRISGSVALLLIPETARTILQRSGIYSGTQNLKSEVFTNFGIMSQPAEIRMAGAGNWVSTFRPIAVVDLAA